MFCVWSDWLGLGRSCKPKLHTKENPTWTAQEKRSAPRKTPAVQWENNLCAQNYWKVGKKLEKSWKNLTRRQWMSCFSGRREKAKRRVGSKSGESPLWKWFINQNSSPRWSDEFWRRKNDPRSLCWWKKSDQEIKTSASERSKSSPRPPLSLGLDGTCEWKRNNRPSAGDENQRQNKDLQVWTMKGACKSLWLGRLWKTF